MYTCTDKNYKENLEIQFFHSKIHKSKHKLTYVWFDTQIDTNEEWNERIYDGVKFWFSFVRLLKR